jgi:hypothetical protein
MCRDGCIQFRDLSGCADDAGDALTRNKTSCSSIVSLCMENLDKHKEVALVFMSLNIATLITCFAIAFAVY